MKRSQAIPFVLTALLCLAVSSCGTVAQKPVEAKEQGFYVKPIAVQDGYLVDGAFRDRYNGLIEVYGNKKLDNGAPVFVPPLKKDDGLVKKGNGQWLMSKQAMENMVVLNGMLHRGVAP